MKKITIAIAALAISLSSEAQKNEINGQYFQNMGAYSPALVGMNDQLDFTLGVRKQWAGFRGAPQNVYLSGYGVLHTRHEMVKLHTNADTTGGHIVPSLRHGVGGSIVNSSQSDYKQTEVNFNYALHIPVFNATYLSLGVIPSINNARFDMQDMTLKEQDQDGAYQALLQNGASKTTLQLNAGLGMHSNNYYVSYSLIEAAQVFISGNDRLNDDKAFQRHHFMGGYRFQIKENLELMPNAFVRLDRSRPALYELGLRARYKQQYWAGLSMRNDKTALIMLGVNIQDKWRVGYTYEHKSFGIAGYSQGSHEIVIGVRLFNANKFSAMW